MADQQESDSEIDLNVNHAENRHVGDVGGEDGDHIYINRRAPHIKPDPYTGEEDWDQFIAYLEDCAELARWTEREKLLYLATSLQKQARLHYSSLPEHERRSYKILTAQLERRYGSKRQVSRWLSKIQNRTHSATKYAYTHKKHVSLGPEAQDM